MRKLRKKEHRNVVHYLRAMNKNIGGDAYLGLNRFYIRLYSEQWDQFDDNSGGDLCCIFEIRDRLTGNRAFFSANNFNYKRKISIYANDFLIRCSSGHPGHIPALNYYAYDVHQIISYDKTKVSNEGETINTYDYCRLL